MYTPVDRLKTEIAKTNDNYFFSFNFNLGKKKITEKHPC